MIPEPQGHKARFFDAMKSGDKEAARAAAKAYQADFVNNIVECPKCSQRNRVPMDTEEQFERAVKHARCGACKTRLLCFCGRCK